MKKILSILSIITFLLPSFATGTYTFTSKNVNVSPFDGSSSGWDSQVTNTLDKTNNLVIDASPNTSNRSLNANVDFTANTLSLIGANISINPSGNLTYQNNTNSTLRILSSETTIDMSGTMAIRGQSTDRWLLVKTQTLNINNSGTSVLIGIAAGTTIIQSNYTNVASGATLTLTGVTSGNSTYASGEDSKLGSVTMNGSLTINALANSSTLYIKGISSNKINAPSTTLTFTNNTGNISFSSTSNIRTDFYGNVIGGSGSTNLIIDAGSNQAFRSEIVQNTIFTVKTGGQLHLNSGTGTNNGRATITLQKNSTISAISMDSEVGTLNAASILSAASTIHVDVDTVSLYDQIVLTGAFTKDLANWSLNDKIIFDFSGIDSSMIGQELTLMTYASTTFTNVNDFSTSDNIDGIFTIGSKGLTFEITNVIPEPAEITALFGIFSLLFVYRRRK